MNVANPLDIELMKLRTAVCTLLILALGFPAATTAELKHVDDLGKVKQVVSVLRGISKKLAVERKKENVVYDEIKRYCEASKANLQSSANPESDSDAENAEEKNNGGPRTISSSNPGSDSDAENAEDEATVAALENGSDRSSEDTEASHAVQNAVTATHASAGDGVPTAAKVSITSTKLAKVLIASTKQVPQVQPSTPQVTPEEFDNEDPTKEIEQMDAELGALGEEPDPSPSNKESQSKHIAAPAVDIVQQTLASATATLKGTNKVASVSAAKPPSKQHAQNRLTKAGGPAPKRHKQDAHVSVAKAAPKRHKQDAPVSVVKAAPKRLQSDDSASVDQLAKVVQDAIEPDDQTTMNADVIHSELVQPVNKVDPSTASYEPLDAGLSIDDTSLEESGGYVPPDVTAENLPQAKMVLQAVPERPQNYSPEVPDSPPTKLQDMDPQDMDPQLQAVQSEFQETENEVANLEKDDKDLPTVQVPSTGPTVAKQPISSVAKALSKAQQQQKDDASVAAMSAAFTDLGGAIPSIDQQALQLYNSFGGEPASVETLGGLSSSPAFLQTSQHSKLHSKLAPVVRADLDAAMDALKEVADDTKNAMDMMEVLRNTVDTDATPATAASGASPIVEQCTLLMRKFKNRQQVRAKREADLEQRSQRLLQSVPASHERKAKNLRRHH